VTEREGLQPRESSAGAGAADEDRQLAADQLATAAQEGDDAGEIGQTRARGGEVFVKITEKKQLPDFEFFRRARSWRLANQKRAPGEKVPKGCNSEINKVAACDRLNQVREPKWESWSIGEILVL
jgi:hypothetical protein